MCFVLARDRDSTFVDGLPQSSTSQLLLASRLPLGSGRRSSSVRLPSSRNQGGGSRFLNGCPTIRCLRDCQILATWLYCGLRNRHRNAGRGSAPAIPVEYPMPVDLRPLVTVILEEYILPKNGIHGVAHWARVMENGNRLCELTGANVDVVRLFAIFHDSRRRNEHNDPDHGQRGAEFAKRLRGSLFALPDEEFNLLHRACVGHTHELTHPDLTIQTCWDSDRLDLGRVGITPHPSRLCTEAAKRSEIIQWSDGRGAMGVVPVFVVREWGVEL